MDKDYWNRVGRDYDEEIFDVRANDLKGTVEAAIDALANLEETAIDFGCGPGEFSEFLAARFAQVDALDISESCLTRQGRPAPSMRISSFVRSICRRRNRGFDPRVSVCASMSC